MISHALHYLKLGLSVIPVHTILEGKCSCGSDKCSAPGKHPRIKWRGASSIAFTEEDLIKLWTRFPDSNIGIVTGSLSGIAVIDVDGEAGFESLRQAGLAIDTLPATPMVRTGGGGCHAIYRLPERMKIKTGTGILHKVDIRAEGGMIVAPPSKHISGREYEWVEGRSIDDLDPADFDFSLLIKDKDKEDRPSEGKGPSKSSIVKKNTKWFEELLVGVGEGARNEAATKLAGRYFAMGMSSSEVLLLLAGWNQRNSPPIAPSELEVIVGSIRGRDQKQEGEERSETLDMIGQLLRMRLLSVSRITGDAPQFVLDFDCGKCMMDVGQMLSPKLFQQVIAGATKKVVRKLSATTNPTHDRLAQMIMNCAEDIDAGKEATEDGEMLILLRDFLRGQRVIPPLENGEEIPNQGCFKLEGLVWMNVVDLIQRSGARWGIKISIKQMAQKLSSLGLIKRGFSTPEGTEKIMWGIDFERFMLIKGVQNGD